MSPILDRVKTVVIVAAIMLVPFIGWMLLWSAMIVYHEVPAEKRETFYERERQRTDELYATGECNPMALDTSCGMRPFYPMLDILWYALRNGYTPASSELWLPGLLGGWAFMVLPCFLGLRLEQKKASEELAL